jgi:hypothetical protein
MLPVWKLGFNSWKNFVSFSTCVSMCCNSDSPHRSSRHFNTKIRGSQLSASSFFFLPFPIFLVSLSCTSYTNFLLCLKEYSSCITYLEGMYGSMFIWQQFNHWQHDGDEDDDNISTSAGYCTGHILPGRMSVNKKKR